MQKSVSFVTGTKYCHVFLGSGAVRIDMLPVAAFEHRCDGVHSTREKSKRLQNRTNHSASSGQVSPSSAAKESGYFFICLSCLQLLFFLSKKSPPRSLLQGCTPVKLELIKTRLRSKRYDNANDTSTTRNASTQLSDHCPVGQLFRRPPEVNFQKTCWSWAGLWGLRLEWGVLLTSSPP